MNKTGLRGSVYTAAAVILDYGYQSVCQHLAGQLILGTQMAN